MRGHPEVDTIDLVQRSSSLTRLLGSGALLSDAMRGQGS